MSDSQYADQSTHPQPAPGAGSVAPGAEGRSAAASDERGAPPEQQSGAPAESARNPSNAGGISDEQVKLALRKVKDPELNLNVVDLGLIYGVTVEDGNVEIAMTLTSPGCPSGPQIMGDVEKVIRALPGVGEVNVNLVWSPFWSPDRIEPRVRAYLGL